MGGCDGIAALEKKRREERREEGDRKGVGEKTKNVI